MVVHYRIIHQRLETHINWKTYSKQTPLATPIPLREWSLTFGQKNESKWSSFTSLRSVCYWVLIVRLNKTKNYRHKSLWSASSLVWSWISDCSRSWEENSRETNAKSRLCFCSRYHQTEKHRYRVDFFQTWKLYINYYLRPFIVISQRV